MTNGTLRPMKTADLDLVLSWRNKKEIREKMYTTHVISREEHQAWWSRISSDDTCQYFMFEDEGKPLGVVGFSKIDLHNKNAEWAFYSGDNSVRGIGTRMEIAALDYAFETLELNKLSCEVLESNERVVRFHRKFGFEVEGIYRQQRFRSDKFEDVYRLAIMRKNWLERVRPTLVAGGARSKYRAGQKFSDEFYISSESINQFAKCSGDLNRVHTDREAAIAAGFEREIAHGAYLISLVSKILGMDFPGAGTIFLGQDMRFLRPVYVGTTVQIELVVLSVIGRRLAIEVTAKTTEGNVLALGEAQLLFEDDRVD